MLERYFTPYQSSCAVTGDRVAILAPHPDDEIFGCGGSACKWAEQGKRVQSFILTDGVVTGEFDDQPDAFQKRQAKAELRANESRSAARLLNLPEPEYLHGQDGALWDDQNIEQQLRDRLHEWRPTTLVAPSVWEMHRDHRATAEMAIRLAQHLPTLESLCFYEIGVPLMANALEDISSYQARKWQAMRCFHSQLATQNYAQQINGLNVYRTYTLGMDTSAVEAFHCIPIQNLDAFQRRNAPDQTSFTLRNAEQKADQQQRRIHELEHMLYQMHRSRSWRLTKPLRWLNKFL
ncbi:PIG-L deacetylase family protein [Marinomonas gallaica]|uniref:PIG-L deacetylase family protein n=1 Tax=Marinomonas gallaica TaxID=1806667 RepID=UPI003A8D3ACD